MMYSFNLEDEFSHKSPEFIREEQTRLLNEHIAYCRERSPFYKRTLANFPKQDITIEELQELPTTSKTELATCNEEFFAVPNSELSDICFTSGTTGKPCKIAYTQNDLNRLAYNDAVGFREAGMTPEDTVLITCTQDRCFIAGLAYYGGVIKTGAAAIRNGLNTMESHADVFCNTKVTGIVGVPSFLAKLGQFLEDNKVDASGVHVIPCIGEPLRMKNMALTPLGEKLEHFWPGAAYSTYASTEMVTSFMECKQHCGGHPPADIAIVEILDDDGRPLPPGEIGEVTITPLKVTGMPLVRFKTGDISFQIPETCKCGRNTLRLGPILGRKSQMLKVRGTTLFPAVFFNVLDGIEEIDNYYMVAKGDNLSDEIELYVSFKSGDVESLHVQEALYAKSRIRVKINTVTRDEARKQVFGTSRKPVRFIDLRK